MLNSSTWLTEKFSAQNVHDRQMVKTELLVYVVFRFLTTVKGD